MDNQQSPLTPILPPLPPVNNTPLDNASTPASTTPAPVAVSTPASTTATNRPIIAKKLQGAYNILVTVSNDPTIDQLAAMIALTLTLSKMKKHSSAVYSGQTPSIIEFLEPEKTIEKTTDSLRDFIIAIDKAKADKLRYKVEDNLVRIFITPYRTSITEKDLNFSLGDLNVDVIVALGVNKQEEVDQAIMAHGKILHDAVVISVSNSPERQTVGNLNWVDTTASSLSEMVTLMANDMGAKDLIDSQIATALLTGIVSNTNRFANDKTSPSSLSVSAQLLSAGANQQLVADKMSPPASIPNEPVPVQVTLPPEPVPVPAPQETPILNPQPSLIKSEAQKKNEAEKANIGELDIDHNEEEADALTEAEKIEKIRIDQSGLLHKVEEGAIIDSSENQSALAPSTPVVANPLDSPASQPNGYMTTPPSSMAGSESESSDFSEKTSTGQDDHSKFMFSGVSGSGSPSNSNNLDSARKAVDNATDNTYHVPASFNALPLGDDLHPNNQVPVPEPTMSLPTSSVPAMSGATSPPPVPPPIISPSPPVS